MSKTDLLNLSDFLIGVGQLKFRGTSLLFRLNRSINDLLLAVYDGPTGSNLRRCGAENGSFQQDGNVPLVSVGGYELATHTVKVKRSGMVADISTLWELEGATTPLLNKMGGKDLLAMFEEMSKPQFGRIHSIDVFNQVQIDIFIFSYVCVYYNGILKKKNQPNEMLNGLRYYERAVKESATSFAKVF